MAVQIMEATPLDRVMNSIVGRARTTKLNDLASLRLGEPSSVTRTVIKLVVFTSASDVDTVSRPVTALIVAVAGAPGSRLKARLFAGRSGSVAEFETVSVAPAWMVR